MNSEAFFDREGALDTLLSCFAKGRLADAERIARELRQWDAKDDEALRLLAEIVNRQGRLDEAVGFMRLLLEQDPLNATYYDDMGAMLAGGGRWAEAEEAHRLALVLDSRAINAQFNLALVLFRQQKTSEALQVLDSLEEKEPDFAAQYGLRGEILLAEKRHDEAVTAFSHAVALGLESSDVLVNLAMAQSEAKALLEKSEKNDPENPRANFYLDNCRLRQGQMDATLDSYRKAVNVAPESFVAWNNLGETYARLQRLDEAEMAYRRALEIKPGADEAELNLGILLLLRGDFENGWKYYEKRWEMPLIRANRPCFQQPEWLGEPLDGKTLLIYVEQGMGDNLQFVRYFQVLRDRYPTARLYYWCLRPLFRLFSSYAARCNVELLPETVQGGIPPIDFHCALLTLPGRLGTTIETIPADVPYLTSPADLVARWASRLSGLNGKRVGVVWGSGDTYIYHLFRSIPLGQIRSFFEVDGVSWVSLQKGCDVIQISEEGLSDRILDLMEGVEDFADTAAIIANLDLVISVDTSVAHLAGAMGKPVWLLERFDTDWRWLLGRTDSPWYPTMRIFRQTSFADWDSVLPRVIDALSAWVADGTGTSAPLTPSPLPMPGTVLPVPGLKLNLGCGSRKMAGFLNVDCVAVCHPDIVVDLEKTPWPWQTDAVEEIKLIHVLEHLGQSTDVFLSIIKEMYRVCRDGARIEIVVPHPRSDHYLGDPTHVRPVTIAMLQLFDQRLNREWAAMGAANTPLGIILDVDFEMESAIHLLEQVWQQKLTSGQMSEAELAFAVGQYNNVVMQTTIVLRVRKGR